ncbi:hypothetical protein N7491_006387 [Penicillium cf. griseofulvum]|uniref:Uncharacterized protein n=1 Tax=Penicillium cf. griseofulvum TaxID=2972120 RepID=A0A9W9IZM9_9EURO|nr:hypothetical protein N7472_010585 [Penicillium cf. griseofulvum]KAJ5429371.1 hypothetical protein N7491_006387 [Penicillium cf. griseofulvum]
MSTRTAFINRIDNEPVADGSSGYQVVWVTVYFDPDEARLNDLELVRYTLTVYQSGLLETSPTRLQSMKWQKRWWTAFIGK